jgi:hypothetical protein
MTALTFGQTPSPTEPPVSDQSKMLEALKAQAIVFNIQTRQKTGSGKVSWQSDYTKVTVHGRPVIAKLEGGNTLIAVQMTPYNEGDSLVLLVQTQIWIRGHELLQYYTSVLSVPAKFGESLFFYPLGQPDATQQDSSIVEVEVIMRPYVPPTGLDTTGGKP